MRKNFIIVFFVVIVVILFGFVAYFNLRNVPQIRVGDEKLNDSFLKIYTISDNKALYTSFYNIDYVTKNGSFSLGDALNKNLISLEVIKSKSTSSDELNDGGTIIYQYKKGKFSNKDFVLVDCNVIDGSKDVYIISGFDYTNSVCK